MTEFSHSQEAKLAEAQQKAMLKGEAFPDIPMTLYEAIVRDYTGRTPEAREQTLIVTHLNEDRRVLNSMIHDAREKAGELGKEQVMVPVLNTANIRDGELRRLSTWENKTEGTAPVRSRKTIINVTTPPKWKVKKQKLAEKAAREAELAAKKAQARQALSIYLNLPSLDEAVNTLKPWWPGLFDGDTPRLLACGIRDVLLEDVAQRNIPLSHKKLRRALKAITRSESYLCAMKAGACRYDTEGYVTEHISQEEETYAAERLDKIRRQNRIKAELQAVLDEK